ncbi:MAG: pre-peptidase C-terminal domain-containing protein [Sandaracinaceae bacterium]
MRTHRWSICAWISMLALAMAGIAMAGCAVKLERPAYDVASTGEQRPTFEAFLADVVRDEEGVFIYDGDLSAPDEEALRALYDALFPEQQALIVQSSGGTDRVWSATQRHQLTYCVSTSFGAQHDQVVTAIEAATDDWMEAADVSFQHVAEQDANCTASNSAVLFDVRPTTTTSYLARAFFPGYSRGQRNILVSTSAFRSSTPLAGVLRHELGHVLGFLHEHIRRPSTPCPEGGSYREVTPYDPGSVMHYPQCGGTNFRLDLSALDVSGAQSIYGAPASAPPPTTPPPPSTPPTASGTPKSGTATSSVARGGEVPFSALNVLGGTPLTVSMTGTGDADLYVRFGAAPTTSLYDCRPYRSDANETCTLTVPSGVSTAYITVRGYTDASFNLTASWTEP